MTTLRLTTLQLRFHLRQPRWTQSINLPGARSNPPIFFVFFICRRFFDSFWTRPPPLLSLSVPRDLFNMQCTPRALQVSGGCPTSLCQTPGRGAKTAGDRRSRSIHLRSVYLHSDAGFAFTSGEIKQELGLEVWAGVGWECAGVNLPVFNLQPFDTCYYSAGFLSCVCFFLFFCFQMSAVKSGQPEEVPSLLVVSKQRIYFLEITSESQWVQELPSEDTV